MVVFAPASVQEAVELTQRAFDVADQYRMPAMILGDGVIGQMMEPVEMPEYKPRPLPKKDWAATGWDGKSRARAVINSLYIEADRCEELNLALKKQYEEIAKNECMVEEQYMDDAEYVIAAYGTTARIALTAIRQARAQGVKAGLIRPITLWPFPSEAFARAAQKAKKFLTVEMSLGQMVDDVRIAVNGARPVEFYGRTGGVIPGVGEITRQILKLAGREG